MMLKFGILSLLLGLAVAGETYTDSEARTILSANGIQVNKPHPTTSLQGVRKSTISGIINFKENSRCTTVITGGTESGHSSGTKSHANGYKLDIRINTCVDNYINNRCTPKGVRSDGAKMFDCSGATFAKESNHWDVLFP